MFKKNKKAFRHSSTFYRKKAKIMKALQTNANTDPLELNELPNGKLQQKTQMVMKYSVEAYDAPRDIRDRQNTLCQNNPEAVGCSEVLFPTDFDDDDDDLYLQIDTENENEEEHDNTQENLRADLKSYIIENSVPHSHANKLLEILRANRINGLPKDVRTLIGTPKTIEIQQLGSGEFWYYGVENCLRMVEYPESINQLKLNFHIDGLPDGKSTKKQFWPILMNVANVPKLLQRCFVVAIYFGNSKPDTAELYLNQFIAELLNLFETGIESMEEKKLSVKINAFICDTPARAFIKCVVSHNAYHSCIKCKVKGHYDKKGRHMSFPQSDCERRSDSSFRNKDEPEHHQKDKSTNQIISSPLERLSIDMIKDFVVADSLHLIDIGLTKKCLTGWVNGSYNFKEKFFIPQVKMINEWLQRTNSMVPRDIHRAVRGLDCLSFWKGTEYRTFLLYLGPVILIEFLSPGAYTHFMLLFCSVTILSSRFYTSKPTFLKTAEVMLVDYIAKFTTLYGEDAISSNVHSLCHIVDDVERFGCLSEISTYKFENELGIIKNLLRSGNKPLVQIAKRLTEKTFTDNECQKKSSIVFKKPNDQEGLFDILILNDIVCQANTKDQWFLSKNNEVIKMLGACGSQEFQKILGCSVRNLESFFTYPVESTKLNSFMCSKFQLSDAEYFPIFNIKCKLVQLERASKLFFSL